MLALKQQTNLPIFHTTDGLNEPAQGDKLDFHDQAVQHLSDALGSNYIKMSPHLVATDKYHQARWMNQPRKQAEGMHSPEYA